MQPQRKRSKDGAAVAATTSVLDYVHLSAAVLQRARQGVPLAQIGRAVDETLRGNVPNYSGQNAKAVASPLLNAGGTTTVVRPFSEQQAAYHAAPTTPRRGGSAGLGLPPASASSYGLGSAQRSGGTTDDWMADLNNALASRVSSNAYHGSGDGGTMTASVVPVSPMRPPAASYGSYGSGSFGSGMTPLYSVSKASASASSSAIHPSAEQNYTGVGGGGVGVGVGGGAAGLASPKLRWNPKNAGGGLGAASGGLSALVTGLAPASASSYNYSSYNSMELLPPGADGSVMTMTQQQQQQHPHHGRPDIPPFPFSSASSTGGSSVGLSRLGEPSMASSRAERELRLQQQHQGSARTIATGRSGLLTESIADGSSSSLMLSNTQRSTATVTSTTSGAATGRSVGDGKSARKKSKSPRRDGSDGKDGDDGEGSSNGVSKPVIQVTRMGKHFDLAASATQKYSTTVIQLASQLPAVLANSMQQTASVVTVPSVPDVFSSILGDALEQQAAAAGYGSDGGGLGSPGSSSSSPGRPGSTGGRRAMAALAAAGLLPSASGASPTQQPGGGGQPLIGADSVFGESVDSLVQTATAVNNAAAAQQQQQGRRPTVGFSEGTMGGLSSGSPSPNRMGSVFVPGGEMGTRFPAKNPGLDDLPEALKSSLRLFAPPQSRTESWLSRGKNKVDHLRLMLKSAGGAGGPDGSPGSGAAAPAPSNSPTASSPTQGGPADPDSIPTDRLPTVNQLMAEGPTGTARNRVLREINEDEHNINGQQSNVAKTVKGIGHSTMNANLLGMDPLAAMGFGISSGEEARKRLAEKRTKAELEEQLKRQRRAKRKKARKAARDLAGAGKVSDDDGADLDSSDEEDRIKAGLENKERMRTIEKLRTDLARLAQRAKFMQLQGSGAPIDAALDELEEGLLPSQKGDKVRLRLTLPADPTPALKASNELEQTSTLRVAIERAKLNAASPWAAREAVIGVLETARSAGMSTAAIAAAVTKRSSGPANSPRRQREAERDEEKKLLEQLDKMKKQQEAKAAAEKAAKKKRRRGGRRGSEVSSDSSDEEKSDDEDEKAEGKSGTGENEADDAAENKEEEAALYTAKVYGPQFNSSPEAQIYYGSTVALETVDGWFLTVHPRTGVVSVREPEPFWYEKGTMPFRKSRTIGGAYKELPLYLFKVVNLKNPMENGPVRFGDPVYLQVCTGRGENGWKTGSILAPYLHHAISIDTAGVDLFGRPADFHAAGKAGESDPLLKEALMAASAENLLFGMPATAASFSVQQRKTKLATVGLGHILGPHDENDPKSRLSSRATTTAGGGSSSRQQGRRSGSPSPSPSQRPDSTLALANAFSGSDMPAVSSNNDNAITSRAIGTPSTVASALTSNSRPATSGGEVALRNDNRRGAVAAHFSGLDSIPTGALRPVDGNTAVPFISAYDGAARGGSSSNSSASGGERHNIHAANITASVYAQFSMNQSGLLGVNASGVLGSLPPEAVAELLELLSHLPPSAAAAILDSRSDAAGNVGSGVYNALSALASGVLDEQALNRLFPNGVPATRLPFDNMLKSVSYGLKTRATPFQRRTAQFIPSMGASSYTINAPAQLTPVFSNLAGNVPVSNRIAQISVYGTNSESSSMVLAGGASFSGQGQEGTGASALVPVSPSGQGSPRIGSPSAGGGGGSGSGSGGENDGEDGGGTFLTALALTSGGDKPATARSNNTRQSQPAPQITNGEAGTSMAIVPADGTLTAGSSLALGASVIIGDGALSAENSVVVANNAAQQHSQSMVKPKDGPTLQELVAALMHQLWYSRELPKAKTMDQISIVQELQKDVAGNARPNPLDRVGKHLGIPRPIVAHTPVPFSANDFLYGPATASNRQGVYRRNDPGFSILYEMANARPIMAGKWRFQVALKEVTEEGYVIGALGFEGHIEDEQYIAATNIKRLLQKAKKNVVKTVTKQEDPLHGAATVLALKRSAKGPKSGGLHRKDPFASTAKKGSLEGADTMDTAAQVAGIAGDDDDGPGNSAVAKAKNANASAAMAAAMMPSENDLVNDYIMNLTEIYLEQEWYYIAYSPAQPGDPEAIPGSNGANGGDEEGEGKDDDRGALQNGDGEGGNGEGVGPEDFDDDDENAPVGGPQLNLLGNVHKGPGGAIVQPSSFVGADGVMVKVASSTRDSSNHYKQKYDGISGGNRRATHLQGTATSVMGQYKIDKRGVFRIRLLQSGDKSEGAQMSRDDSIALRARSQLRNSERLRVGVITEEEAAAQAAAKEAEGDPSKRIDINIPINEETITNQDVLKKLREGNLSLKAPGVTPAEKLPRALRLARARALIEAGSRYLSHEALKFGVPEKYYHSRLDGVMGTIAEESSQITQLAVIAETNELNRIQRKTPFLKRAKNVVPYREQLARVELKMEAERTARLYNSSRSVRGTPGAGGMNSPPHTPITAAAVAEINNPALAQQPKPYVFVGPQLGVGLGGPSARELDKMAARNNKKKGGPGFAPGSSGFGQGPPSSGGGMMPPSAGSAGDSRGSQQHQHQQQHTHAHGPNETCRLCSSSSGAPIFVVDLCTVGTQAKSDLVVEMATEAEEERIRRLQKAINEGVIFDEDDPRAAAVMEGKDPDAEQEEDPLAASNIVIFKRPASIAAVEAEKQKRERQKRRREAESMSGTGKPRSRGRPGISGRRKRSGSRGAGTGGEGSSPGGSSVSPSGSSIASMSMSRPVSSTRSASMVSLSRLGTTASPSRTLPVRATSKADNNNNNNNNNNRSLSGSPSRGGGSISPGPSVRTASGYPGSPAGQQLHIGNSSLLVRASGAVNPYAGIVAASQTQSRLQTAITAAKGSPSPSPSPSASPVPGASASPEASLMSSAPGSIPGTAASPSSVMAGGALAGNKRKNSIRRLTIGLTEALKQRKSEIDYDAPMPEKIEAREVALGTTVEMMNKHKAKMKALQEKRQKEAEEEQARAVAAAAAAAQQQQQQQQQFMQRSRGRGGGGGVGSPLPPIEAMMMVVGDYSDPNVAAAAAASAAFEAAQQREREREQSEHDGYAGPSSLSLAGSMAESDMVLPLGESILEEDEATGALLEVPGATIVSTFRSSESSASSSSSSSSATASARGAATGRGRESKEGDDEAPAQPPPPQALRRRNSVIVDVTSAAAAAAVAQQQQQQQQGGGPAPAGGHVMGVNTLTRRLSVSGGAGMIVVSSVSGVGEKEPSRPQTMTSTSSGTDSIPPTAGTGAGAGGRRSSISGKAFRAPPDPHANLDALLQVSSDSVEGAEKRFLSTLSKQDNSMLEVLTYQRTGGLLPSIEARFAAARRAAAAAANGEDDGGAQSGVANLGLSHTQSEEELQRETLSKLASRAGHKPGTGGLIPGSRNGSRVDSAVAGDLLTIQQPASRTAGVATPTHGRRAGVVTPGGGGPNPPQTPSRQWPPESRPSSRSPSRGGGGMGGMGGGGFAPSASLASMPSQAGGAAGAGGSRGTSAGTRPGSRSAAPSSSSVFVLTSSQMPSLDLGLGPGGGSSSSSSTGGSHGGSRVGTGHGSRA